MVSAESAQKEEEEGRLHLEARVVADQMKKVFGVEPRAYVVDENNGGPLFGQVGLTLADARRILQCRANLLEEDPDALT